MAFMGRAFNAVINTRGCVVLKTRPDELRRYDFVEQSLRVDACWDKLNRMVEGR
jgi:hypothetical protein